MINKPIRIFRHELVHDALALGWMVAIPGSYACHDHYSVACVWLCECKKAIEPLKH